MRLRNTTDIPNEVARQVIKFVMPSGVTNVDVMLKNSANHYGGMAYINGTSYHGNNRKLVTVRIGGEYRRTGSFKRIGFPKVVRQFKQFPFMLTPYQYGQHKGRKVWIANRIEMLVYIAAHELRHIWQGKAKNKSGYAWGSRGRYSEIDTEAYALRMLRRWRGRH